jgi:hypothetical protein
MSLAVWIALAFLLVALVASAVVLGLRVRAFMRTFRTFGAAADRTSDALNRSLERLDRSSAELESSTPRLQASVERLRISLAQLAVLQAAVKDVQDSVGRLAGVYPRK